MYNLLNGENPHAEAILAQIMLTPIDFYRYRDTFVKQTGTDAYEIHVYTRGGGGNRECWNGSSCEHADCVEAIQERLRTHPLYVSDEDDDFDCTYSTFVFRAPTKAVAEEFFAANETRGKDTWHKVFETLDAARTGAP